MKRFSRREFIRRLSLGAAGAYTTFNVPRSFAATPGGTEVIDPPVGALFKDPVEMASVSRPRGAVEVNIEARPALVNINGTMANVLTYNGSWPGPTIRVRRGDILKAHFKNSLPSMGTNMRT
jgi:FtsP/CotA-like multicopper oxidase with cupredoxin domain